ncbi:MAG: anti-phage defense ZorAB system ZorA [Clostridia bacterium]|nr:anti-phage defense ZorAB system ZorA [Clostridia bacterium]
MEAVTSFLSSIGMLQGSLVDYLVYLAIVIVMVIGIFKCLVPLWGTTHSLRQAVSKLQDEAGTHPDRPVWQEARFMGKRLRVCWMRFLQNAEQLDRRGLPCNVEDYVNDDTVTYGPGNAQLAELVPSLLTSLGILGTFLGMTQGLSGLDVTTTENMMSGVQNLLSGMHFAFGTSVAGVSCSLLFNMLNRIAQGSSFRAIDDFTEAFTQLAMQRPLDNDVQLICQNQDRNHLLGNVNDALTVQVPRSIENAMRSSLQPVARSMDAFMLNATSAQIDGMQRLVDHYIASMNKSLDGQFLTLGQTMTSINQNQQLSVSQLSDALNATRGMLSDAQRMHQVSSDILSQFERYVSELGEARKRDEGFEQNATDLLSRMSAAEREQAQTIQQMKRAQEDVLHAVQVFQQSGREQTQGIQNLTERNVQAMETTGRTVADAGQKLSKSYEQFVDHVVEGLSRSLGMFENSMNGIVRHFSEEAEKISETISEKGGSASAADLSEIQRILTSIQKSLEDKTAASTKEA